MSGAPTVPNSIEFPSVEEVHALAVRSLGLDPASMDLQAPEALSALIRRAASLLSPCAQRMLRESTLRCLTGLVGLEGVGGADEWRSTIDESIESLVIYGDLLELPISGEASIRQLYLAPPTFVDVDGVMFLLGGLADGIEAIPSGLLAKVEYRNHTRRIVPSNPEETGKHLQAIGWIALPAHLWLAPPRRVACDELVARANAALEKVKTTGDVSGLSLLDPDSPTTYYRGRWVRPERKTGRFVARREQQFGANLWSYVDISDGIVTRLVDLPFDASHEQSRPCDVAWHLQMAIDALAGHPQHFRLRPSSPSGSVIVDFFSPVPLWAKRRWDVIGEEVARSNSLFAYRFPEKEFTDVLRSFDAELFLRAR